MGDVAFTARLDKSDWNAGTNGWRCPALKIPGATITQVYASGKPVDKSFYQVIADETIRWIPDNPPSQINALISLTETLSLRSDTDFWKRLTIVVPIIAALISGFATYLSAPRLSQTEPSQQLITYKTAFQTQQQVLRATLASLRDASDVITKMDSYLASNSCAGGSSGIPIPHGGEYASMGGKIVGNFSSLADQINSVIKNSPPE